MPDLTDIFPRLNRREKKYGQIGNTHRNCAEHKNSDGSGQWRKPRADDEVNSDRGEV